MKTAIFLLAVIALTYSWPIEKVNKHITPRVLEETTTPVSYTIELTPYFKDEGTHAAFTFDGKVTLRIKINDATGRTSLKLNSNQLTYLSVPTIREVIPSTPPVDITVTNLLENLKDTSGVIEFTFDQTLANGAEYDMEFVYTGILGDDMAGFYRSSYKQNLETIWIATTQFQRNDARRAFPSFDEPKYRAKFNVIINKLKTYSAYSNSMAVGEPVEMPGDSTRDSVTFKETPIMSSYLVAFIVAPFYFRTDSSGTYSILARPAQADQTLFAFEVGQKTLANLDLWTGLSYKSMTNVEKMEQAAIPDFEAGAMENWGLLIYRESILLSDAQSSTDKERQFIAQVIAHEQAHQWFGNLVTCENWDYIWLNEGFATYFEYFTTQMAEPEMKMEKQFPNDVVQYGLAMDGTEDTRAMTSDGSPSAIIYEKAGAVIRMMEHYMGAARFQAGVRKYLSDNSYQSVVTSDLFTALQEAASDTLVSTIFREWSEKPGHPVVHVALSGDGTKLEVSQNRFLFRDPLAGKPAVDKTLKWAVPLSYTKQGGDFSDVSTKVVFANNVEKTEINEDIGEGWIIFNSQQSGFYRVNYDLELWTRINATLQSENLNDIDEINRGQIVDDLLNFARSDFEDISYKTALEIISFLKEDTSYLPWAAAISHFRVLLARLPTGLIYRYLGTLIENVYSKLSTVDISTLDSLGIYNRANIMNWACRVGNERCIQNANELFVKYKENPIYNRIDVNIRFATLCSAIRHGNETDYDFLWERYLQEQVSTEQNTILQALGCLSAKSEGGAALLAKHWNNLLSDNVREQDRRSALTATYTNTEENLGYVIDFVIKNFETIESSYGKSELIYTIQLIIPRIISENETDLDKLKSFIENESEFFAGINFEAAINEFNYNKAWSARNKQIIVDYVGGSACINTISMLAILFAALFTYLYSTI